MRCRTSLLPLALAGQLIADPLRAQSTEWTSVEQGATWYSLIVDQAITERAALWFDGQWRRMGLGTDPQQVLLRSGLLVTVAPGARVGAGYAWVATAPYGETPSANPVREHRAWQQLTMSQRVGRLGVTHRYRWEQRWLAPVLPEGTGPWAYQQRARYLVRAEGNLPVLRRAGSAVLGFAWNELLLPIGHGDATLRVTQNRLGAGIGIPLDARQRLEVGYMNLWNALAARGVNEFNHTLTVSLVRSTTR